MLEHHWSGLSVKHFLGCFYPLLMLMPTYLSAGKNGQASFYYSQGCFIGCPTCDNKSGRRQTDLCGLKMMPTNNAEGRSLNLDTTPNTPSDICEFLPSKINQACLILCNNITRCCVLRAACAVCAACAPCALRIALCVLKRIFADRHNPWRAPGAYFSRP